MVVGESKPVSAKPDLSIEAYTVWIAHLDRSGAVIGEASPQIEVSGMGDQARATSDMGALIVSRENRRWTASKVLIWDTALTRIDRSGDTVWRKTNKMLGLADVATLIVMADDGAIIAGDYKAEDSSRSGAALLRIDAKGEVVWRKDFPFDDTKIQFIEAVPVRDAAVVLGKAVSGSGELIRTDYFVLPIGPDGEIPDFVPPSQSLE